MFVAHQLYLCLAVQPAVEGVDGCCCLQQGLCRVAGEGDGKEDLPR